MEECGYCKERDSKVQKYEEEIEKEKVRECLKALEREKIANGMQCTKSDEIKLRTMQKMQMEEKRIIEQKNAEVDELWHRLLLDNVRIKEERERLKAERQQREMHERRTAYDEQIASANRKRSEALQNEREVENRRLENMKKRMERDYYDAIKRKKEQQIVNKKNFIEGHEMKLSRLYDERRREREIDENTILIAMEELRRERQRELNHIHHLKMEKDIFIENFNREKKMSNELQREVDAITTKWKQQEEKDRDDICRKLEMEKQSNRMNAAQEYRRHIQERNQEIESRRQERKITMEKVKRTAYNELQKKINSANEEMRWQIEYRNSLHNQIKANEKILEMELDGIERKQRPFTKKAITFRDAMRDKVHADMSGNPVHPFERIKAQLKPSNTKVSLPLINKFGI